MFKESSFGKRITTEKIEDKIENKAEKEKIPWDTKIILQRHGEFYNQKPGDPEFERLEKEKKLGLLTDKGIEKTREATKEKLSEILENEKPNDIVFLYSPTEWLDWRSEQGWEEGYGSRGKHTTKVILDTIGLELKRRTRLGESIKDKIRISGVAPRDKLRELDIFYIYDAPNPRAYIKALREKFGKEDWWEEYYNIVKDIEPLREETGAESPVDLSNRVKNLIKIISLYREKARKETPNRGLVIWVITHKELIRSYLQHGLKAEETDIKDYEPKHNESIDINITPNSEIISKFKDKKYKVDLNYK